MATREVRDALFKAIRAKAKADMPKAETPRAITTDVLDAIDAVQRRETERESDDDTERRARSRAAQRQKRRL